jgi:hypothetical protein
VLCLEAEIEEEVIRFSCLLFVALSWFLLISLVFECLNK